MEKDCNNCDPKEYIYFRNGRHEIFYPVNRIKEQLPIPNIYFSKYSILPEMDEKITSRYFGMFQGHC